MSTNIAYLPSSHGVPSDLSGSLLDQEGVGASMHHILVSFSDYKQLGLQDEDGKSKGFGFINFENADDAAVAVEKNQGSILEGKEVYCGRAQKKAEREAELRQK